MVISFAHESVKKFKRRGPSLKFVILSLISFYFKFGAVFNGFCFAVSNILGFRGWIIKGVLHFWIYSFYRFHIYIYCYEMDFLIHVITEWRHCQPMMATGTTYVPPGRTTRAHRNSIKMASTVQEGLVWRLVTWYDQEDVWHWVRIKIPPEVALIPPNHSKEW